MSTTMRLSAAVLLLLCVGVAKSAAQDSRTVLVLYSDQRLGPAPSLFTQGLRTSLEVLPHIHLEALHLDLSVRFETDERDHAQADWLTSRYRGRKIPIVVALGVPASVFASRYGQAIWPEARIVHASVDGEAARAAVERGDSVVPRRLEYRRTVELALTLFPGTREVWLVAGASAQDRRWLGVAVADLAPLRQRIRIRQIAGLRWDEVLTKMKTLPSDAVGIGVVFGADADGRTFVTADALSEVARASPRPFFATGSWLVGTGAIGGNVLDASLQGQVTGETVRRLLDNPGATPIVRPPDAATRWMFDATQLRRWNIAESRLPAGSLVVNREVPGWRRYLWTIIATCLLMAAQGAIIGALLIQRRHLRRVEGALRTSEENAVASFHEIRELAGRLINARETERARVARDLHDDIGQRIASLSIVLSRIQRLIPDTESPAKHSLMDLQKLTNDVAEDLQQLSHDLHPGILEHVGLPEALRERCENFTQESGVPVRLDVSDTWGDVPAATALCVYRVAQEALRNVATHAQARHVSLSLDSVEGHLVMRIVDDGCGFDPAATSQRSGLGLVSLHERVRMLGGALVVSAAPCVGTSVTVSLPTGQSHAAQASPRRSARVSQNRYPIAVNVSKSQSPSPKRRWSSAPTRIAR
jgi:signal transduction histidine kinase